MTKLTDEHIAVLEKMRDDVLEIITQWETTDGAVTKRTKPLVSEMWGKVYAVNAVLEYVEESRRELAELREHIAKIVEFGSQDVTLEVYKEIVHHESVDILRGDGLSVPWI